MNPTKITLHHSLTKDSNTLSWGAIRHYHTKVNGWSDIGYHYGVEFVDGEPEILIGRMPDTTGAHVKGHNSDNIGVCFVGNFDNEPVPGEIWKAGVKLVKYLMKEHGITEVVGHCELYPQKSCPGKQFDLDKFRKDVGL